MKHLQDHQLVFYWWLVDWLMVQCHQTLSELHLPSTQNWKSPKIENIRDGLKKRQKTYRELTS